MEGFVHDGPFHMISQLREQCVNFMFLQMRNR
jgi:hypothetical protein